MGREKKEKPRTAAEFIQNALCNFFLALQLKQSILDRKVKLADLSENVILNDKSKKPYKKIALPWGLDTDSTVLFSNLVVSAAEFLILTLSTEIEKYYKEKVMPSRVERFSRLNDKGQRECISKLIFQNPVEELDHAYAILRILRDMVAHNPQAPMWRKTSKSFQNKYSAYGMLLDIPALLNARKNLETEIFNGWSGLIDFAQEVKNQLFDLSK